MDRRTPRGLLTALVLGGCVALLSGGSAAGAPDGGTTTTTTSTTHHDTHTRVDLTPVDAYETRVVAEAGGAVVFERAFGAAPGAPAVVAAVGEARSALVAGGACSISGPVEEGAGSAAADAQVDEEFDHEETSVTTTTTFGPATILIGEDQSQVFFVAPGTTNVNVNTHTESFYDQLFQNTVTQEVTYRLTGAPCGVPPPDPAAVLPERADVAIPVPAQPRTAG
jgi:hypothetical protein